MHRVVIKAALGVTLALIAACTPFLYGGVVVFGPAEEAAPAETGTAQPSPQGIVLVEQEERGDGLF
jgi:hypothetical protein